ncbi:hypothetical protein FEM08_03940 [Flavobacterium gilvum]|nr:hypothetical protein FEM08_03940 [Flavobacterium gilvum]
MSKKSIQVMKDSETQTYLLLRILYQDLPLNGFFIGNVF